MNKTKLNNNSGIYTITNLVNNKIYIGFCQNFASRYGDHKSTLLNNRHGNEYLQNAFNKYGKNNFLFEILEECDKKYLASQENYWSNLLNVHNRSFGYNIQPTHPDNIKIHSKETIEKIRNNTKGIKKSEETKKRMSLSMKGKTKSEAHKINLSKAKLGKPMHEKTKSKLKLANTGRKQSIEEKNKRANSNKKTIIQMDLNENFIKKWDSAVDASNFLKISPKHIYSCCKEKRKSSYNFKWKYDEIISFK